MIEIEKQKNTIFQSRDLINKTHSIQFSKWGSITAGYDLHLRLSKSPIMMDATVGDGHDFEPGPPFLLLEYLWQEG